MEIVALFYLEIRVWLFAFKNNVELSRCEKLDLSPSKLKGKCEGTLDATKSTQICMHYNMMKNIRGSSLYKCTHPKCEKKVSNYGVYIFSL
ncbi:hypothetical protein HHI36_021249 [Cryptolaemus montrouzieri]|uniref:Uncharacterized protein n=1 Tax=Cryptolaemus montrouzieri TaxID=559131 RepID=A0ABD2MW75_9CUCU